MTHLLRFASRLAYSPDGPGIRVPVRLTTGYHSIPLEAYIDTGAPVCVFPRWVAEELELEVEKGDQLVLRTGGGLMEVYGHTLTLVIGVPAMNDLAFDIAACFARNPEFQRSLLGRQGFLDRVRMALIHYDGLLFMDAHDA
ncbi:MAG: aspartyl protease family protein [Blastocatellia bacterium]